MLVFAADGQEVACSIVCSETEACANDPQSHGSYCKYWQSPSVCFGLYVRDDGSTCFQPNDSSCDDDVLEPLYCDGSTSTEIPIAQGDSVDLTELPDEGDSGTLGPQMPTTASSSEAPVDTTAVPPVETTDEPPVETTAEPPVETTAEPP
ncbi:hypothetical protein FOZ62_005445, partial [Perkinsus olseni]